MKIDNLIEFAKEKNIKLENQENIVNEARDNVKNKYKYSTDRIKNNFDTLLEETEKEAYKLYLDYEKRYGEKVFDVFLKVIIKSGELRKLENTGKVLGKYFKLFDKFFLSLAQSRKSRAGKGFEKIHNSLFKILDYPFDEQAVINGKPDFLMPSVKHYRKNPMDCIIFTAKRTLRERWRQIVTEGTRGLGFFLATIDDKVSSAQLKEMLDHRIYLVCPESIKRKCYKDKINVLSFRQFFKDHLDPKIKSWKRNKII
ncbi:MAG: type II restriction endonuclease [Candidatus Moranbacteria bacterium]|nr:type II restriction endonuclease [Candidatus Moranbacteria bacterium]